MKNIIFIIILIIIVLYIYYNQLTYEYYKDEHIKLSVTEKNNLLLCMDIFSKLCDNNKLYYIISFGTLLGSIRHNGMIPWDDDIDLIMLFKDKSKIIETLDIMKNVYNYKIEHEWKLSRIYATDKIFIDIFYVDIIDDYIERCEILTNNCIMPPNDESGKWWHDYFHFPKEWLGDYDNRLLYNYEGRKYKGPINSDKLLSFWYGSNYMTKCQTHFLQNHSTYINPTNIKCFYEK